MQCSGAATASKLVPAVVQRSALRCDASLSACLLLACWLAGWQFAHSLLATPQRCSRLVGPRSGLPEMCKLQSKRAIAARRSIGRRSRAEVGRQAKPSRQSGSTMVHGPCTAQGHARLPYLHRAEARHAPPDQSTLCSTLLSIGAGRVLPGARSTPKHPLALKHLNRSLVSLLGTCNHIRCP